MTISHSLNVDLWETRWKRMKTDGNGDAMETALETGSSGLGSSGLGSSGRVRVAWVRVLAIVHIARKSQNCYDSKEECAQIKNGATLKR